MISEFVYCHNDTNNVRTLLLFPKEIIFVLFRYSPWDIWRTQDDMVATTYSERVPILNLPPQIPIPLLI